MSAWRTVLRCVLMAGFVAACAASLPACGDDDDDDGGAGGDFGDDDDVNADPGDAFDVIKACDTDASNYSFTLSKVPICGVEIQPDEARNEQATSTDNPVVDGSAYAQLMDALLGQVKGYAWVLVSTRPDLSPGIVVENAGGTAWQGSGAAGPVTFPFTVDTLANVGSATKVVSGVSFLHMFENLPTDLNPDGINLETFLKIPFMYFLPDRARKKLDKTLALVTIGHLLRHKTGLVYNTAAESADNFKNLAKGGCDTGKLGTRKYNNMNSVILRYLIPFIDSPGYRNSVNEEFSVFTTLNTMSEVIDKRTRQYFTDYIETVITPTVGGDFELNCTPALEPEGDAAQMFPTFDFEDAGYLSDATSMGGCSSQGGNWFSARGFASFLLAFGAGDLVSEHTRLMMSAWYEPGDTDDDWGTDRLIWSRFGTSGDGTFSQYFNDSFGGGYWFGHGGDHPKTVDGVKFEAHAGLTEFPWGYYGMVVVNSKEFGSSALMLQQRAAFEAALGKP